MITKIDHIALTKSSPSYLMRCEAKDPPKQLEKSSLNPAAPSDKSSWVKVGDFLLSIFSWIKDNLCCWLFDEEEEKRDKQIEQLQQFANLYTEPSMTQAQFDEAFNGLDAALQTKIKNKMPRIIRSVFQGGLKPPREDIDEMVNSILQRNPKFELETNRPSPHDKILVFGEALKAVLSELSKIEPM